METMQIVSWLYDKAARAMDHSYARMLNMTAKRLRELDEKQRWIPVEERLPDPGQTVTVCDVREEWVGCFTYVGGGEWTDNYICFSTSDVTHWMPLPEPPKQTIIKEDN